MGTDKARVLYVCVSVHYHHIPETFHQKIRYTNLDLYLFFAYIWKRMYRVLRLIFWVILHVCVCVILVCKLLAWSQRFWKCLTFGQEETPCNGAGASCECLWIYGHKDCISISEMDIFGLECGWMKWWTIYFIASGWVIDMSMHTAIVQGM